MHGNSTRVLNTQDLICKRFRSALKCDQLRNIHNCTVGEMKLALDSSFLVNPTLSNQVQTGDGSVGAIIRVCSEHK